MNYKSSLSLQIDRTSSAIKSHTFLNKTEIFLQGSHSDAGFVPLFLNNHLLLLKTSEIFMQ